MLFDTTGPKFKRLASLKGTGKKLSGAVRAGSCCQGGLCLESPLPIRCHPAREPDGPSNRSFVYSAQI